MQLRAPAKINLSFKILGRRADGFHEIETLMAPISLHDVITIRRGDGGEIRFACDDASLPQGDDNLVVRAARSFLEAAEIKSGLAIELQKNIPHGAGLGGGSSDAASVLLGLNKLFRAPLAFEKLNAIAAAIGSDVPFFLFGSAAICRGRGELVEPVILPSQLHLLLIKPAFGVPTPWAYGRWLESRELPKVSYSAQEFSRLALANDLERPVFEKHLFLARAKMWLLAQPEVGAAMMSGSGSTMLAALRCGAETNALAARAKAELDPELWTHPCQTVSAE